MKKLTQTALLLTCYLLILTSCRKDNAVGRENQSTDSGYLPNRTFNNAQRGGSGSCVDPYEGMPFGTVQQMINNYRNRQQQAITNGLGFSDANACWFDLERLKDYICHLEAQVDQTQCGNIRSLGIRFYYAAHNATAPLYGVPDAYIGKHTLIMIPTYRDDAGNNVDFDPGKMDLANCKPLPLRSLKGNAVLGNVNIGASGGDNLFAMDHGQLGPPDSVSMSF